MAFTRFNNDPARIQKRLQESTFAGRYQLNTPGQGMYLPFLEDPNIRLQKWGANLRDNGAQLESELFGLTRPLNRDLVGFNDYSRNQTKVTITPSSYYFRETPFVEESRASHPAWMYRDLEQSKWETPLLNPLAHLEKPFNANIQTRILEKDYFVPTVPR
jgi:hypothetical protein